MSHVEFFLGVALGFVSLITAIVGGLGWYRVKVAEAVEKKRDFNHLKNNYSQMSENLKVLIKEIDERFDHIDNQLNRIELRTDRDRTNPL
ncbi:MAG: hypothetical protein ACFB0C_24290 [Leptolyngbyaceae cyanobacterium]